MVRDRQLALGQKTMLEAWLIILMFHANLNEAVAGGEAGEGGLVGGGAVTGEVRPVVAHQVVQGRRQLAAASGGGSLSTDYSGQEQQEGCPEEGRRGGSPSPRTA